jgi:hypothetical protein
MIMHFFGHDLSGCKRIMGNGGMICMRTRKKQMCRGFVSCKTTHLIIQTIVANA